MEKNKSATAPVVQLSLSAFSFTTTFAVLQVLLMATSYVSCVSTKHCPVWLPTISNTWEAHPGSYLSRWVVSLVCLCLELAILTAYHQAKTTSMQHPAGVAWLAGVGVFCLSWVGAICDSKDPSCRGNDAIHTPLAVTFFILFNMYLVIMTVNVTKKKTKLVTLASLATLCQAYFLANHAHLSRPGVFTSLGGDTVIAIIEWSDVLIVLAWFTVYVYEVLPGYRVGFVAVSDSEPKGAAPVTVLSFFSATSLTLAATVLCLLTSLSTWYIGVKTKVVDPHTLPVISDLWWSPPGNWIARWGVVLGSTLIYTHEINVYFTDKAQKNESFLLVLLGVFGAFGLSVVGCVDEKENIDIHLAAAAVFFVAYDLYMLLYTVRSVLSRRCQGALPVAACCIVSTLSKLRYHRVQGMVYGSAVDGPTAEQFTDQSLFAVYEWSDMVACLLFINVSCYYASAGSVAKYGLAIYKTM